MIKVLEIVMVNLGFTSEAASQIINFDETKYTCRSCTSAKVNCP